MGLSLEKVNSDRLFPPLESIAGKKRLTIAFDVCPTIRQITERLVTEFGEAMKRALYDRTGQIIPSWAAFLDSGDVIVQLNNPKALNVTVEDKGEVSFIMILAGG
jgi:molybdopterin converting factor small subunit